MKRGEAWRATRDALAMPLVAYYLPFDGDTWGTEGSPGSPNWYVPKRPS